MTKVFSINRNCVSILFFGLGDRLSLYQSRMNDEGYTCGFRPVHPHGTKMNRTLPHGNCIHMHCRQSRRYTGGEVCIIIPNDGYVLWHMHTKTLSSANCVHSNIVIESE